MICGTVAAGVQTTAKSTGFRDVANALVGFQPQHFRILGVDGIYFALKATVQQVLKDAAAHGAGTAGCANDGYRAWSKHCVQAASPCSSPLYMRY